MRTVTLTLPMTPPSLNRVGSRGQALAFHRHKKQWQRWLELLLRQQNLGRGYGQVHATAVLSFPTSRRRDEGNHRALIEKALGDACTALGVIPDDDADHYRFGRVDFRKGPAETRLTLEIA